MKLLKLRYLLAGTVTILCLAGGLAFTVPDAVAPAEVMSVGISVLELQQDGTMAAESVTTKSEVVSEAKGEAEVSTQSEAQKRCFVADIELSDKSYDLGGVSVAISTKNLKLDENSVRIMLKKGNELTAMSVEPLKFDANNYEFLLKIDGAAIARGGKLQVYFEAKPTGGDAKVTVKVASAKAKEFTQDGKVYVDGYAIEKQSKAMGNIEVAAGLSGMTKNDTVYIIYSAFDSNKELIRVVVQDGAVLGFAIKDDNGIYSLQYDRNTKCYINELTRKPVLAKQELLDVMNILHFSFVTPPDENLWLERQYTFEQSKTIGIKKQ